MFCALFMLFLCGGCVFCDEDAPVWSSDENTIVPEVKIRGKLDPNDDDSILEFFNDCECVMYYLCDDDNYIISDGRGIFNPRLKSSRNVTRLICKKEFHFCCKLRPSDKNLPFPTEHPFKTSTTPISSTIRTTSTSSSSARTTSTPSSSTTTPFRTTTQSPPLTTKCGIQRPTFDDRILTTEPSTIPGEFPWMVAIVIKKSNYEFKCAGSIVHPRVILTASHCVRRAKLDTLRVIYNITEELDFSVTKPNKKTVKKIISHKDFYSGGLYNDIALLILESAIELNGLVNSICLPQQEEVFNYTKCWATGWRDTKPDGNEGVYRYLRKVKVPIVPHRQCENRLKTTRLGADFTLHESFVCAGGVKNEDTCYGDGGAPLVCPIDYEKYIQVGIVSWGVGCGEEGIPGIYTNVVLFRNWIKNEMRKEGLEV